jgi:hypothetical protein
MLTPLLDLRAEFAAADDPAAGTLDLAPGFFPHLQFAL